jgi:hypothetical protein
MIEMYTGAPGSFKSYHATERGILKIGAFKNNHVVANFPIRPRKNGKADRGEWLFVPDDQMSAKLLIKRSLEKGYFGHEGSCLLIIDEAGITFNSRDWQTKALDRLAWIKFFALSRHFGYDCILITQSDRMLDRQIRNLCEFNVKHVNLRNHWALKLIVWWKVFMAVSFWSAGNFRGTAQVGIFKPWIAKRYDTIRAFDTSPDMIELANDCGLNLDTGKQAAEGKGLGVPTRKPLFTVPKFFTRKKLSSKKESV